MVDLAGVAKTPMVGKEILQGVDDGIETGQLYELL